MIILLRVTHHVAYVAKLNPLKCEKHEKVVYKLPSSNLIRLFTNTRSQRLHSFKFIQYQCAEQIALK
jgi:hypothetical protein